VWHASVSSRLALPSREDALFAEAIRQLAGVGDAALGEWREVGNLAMHVRRRLTKKEMQYAAIDEVRDVRGTSEAKTRVDRMRPFLPLPMRDLQLEQFP
jgi:hypothetical protein